MLALLLVLATLPASGDETEYLGKSTEARNAWISAFSVSPDGTLAAIARPEGTIELWNLSKRTLQRQLEAPKKASRFPSDGKLEKLLFTPDGRRVAAVGFGFGLNVWDVETGSVVQHDPGGLYALSISQDGTSLAFGKDFKGEICIWDLTTGKSTTSLRGHKQAVHSLAYSPDGKSLYSCSTDLTVRKWDISTGKEVWRDGEETAEMSIGPTFPHHLALSPDGRHLAVTYHGCWALGGLLRNPENGVQTMEIPVAHSDTLAVMKTKNIFVMQGKSGRLELVDADARKIISRAPAKDSDRCMGAAFGLEGKFLLTPTADGRLKIWDVAAFEAVRD